MDEIRKAGREAAEAEKKKSEEKDGGILGSIREAGREAAEAERAEAADAAAPQAPADAPAPTPPPADAPEAAAPAPPAAKPKPAAGERKQAPAPAPPKKAQAKPAPKKQRVYTVKSGDTLSGIGQRFGVSWQKIYAANKGKIKDPDLIYPGQEFVIPDK